MMHGKRIIHLCFLFMGLFVTAQQRQMVITIDDLLATPADAEQYEYITNALLQTLNGQNVEAIGFVNEGGLYTDGEPDAIKIKILEKWLKAGMELGNHTYSHVYINNTSLKEYKKDVLKGELITRPLMKRYGKDLKYFRHPQLRTGPTEEYREGLNAFLKEHGYVTAPVTIDNDEYIYAFCYAGAKANGNTELMDRVAMDYLNYMTGVFDYYESLSRDFLGYELPQILLIHANSLNADHLGKLIALLKKRGYVFVTLEEALKDDAYRLPEGTHARGLSWLQRWMKEKGDQPGQHPEISGFIQELYEQYRG